MPQPRPPPHDPFTTTSTTAGLSSGPSLRPQPANPSLRSTATAASTRTRQGRDLFAPTLSRRPTTRGTPRLDDDVLPDSESEQELGVASRQRQQLRRIRQGSPESRPTRSKPKPQQPVEDLDIVNRQQDGSYILGGPGLVGIPAVPAVFGQNLAETVDQEDAAIARKYFMSGAHMGSRASRHAEDEFERERPEVMMRMREQALAKLEDERWMYEPSDRYQNGGP
ncbi:unnamed protein product [Zymoseptoria tritici ST99CH_3D1]|nr:unnamed protein product [Zymoseptoria tritici ST99CH_3D1]